MRPKAKMQWLHCLKKSCRQHWAQPFWRQFWSAALIGEMKIWSQKVEFVTYSWVPWSSMFSHFELQVNLKWSNSNAHLPIPSVCIRPKCRSYKYTNLLVSPTKLPDHLSSHQPHRMRTSLNPFFLLPPYWGQRKYLQTAHLVIFHSFSCPLFLGSIVPTLRLWFMFYKLWLKVLLISFLVL